MKPLAARLWGTSCPGHRGCTTGATARRSPAIGLTLHGYHDWVVGFVWFLQVRNYVLATEGLFGAAHNMTFLFAPLSGETAKQASRCSMAVRFLLFCSRRLFSFFFRRLRGVVLRVGCAEESVVVDPNAHGRSRLVGVLPSLDWKHGHDCGIACTRDGGRLWLLVVDGGTRIQNFSR